MSNIKRLFFATHITSELIINDLLPRLKKELRLSSISWAKPEQMHVTLKFFGDTPDSRIPEIEKALSGSLKNHQEFDIELKHVKLFGSRYKPQVIWLGMEDHGEMRNLFRDVQEQLGKIGYQNDRQNFVPHLTLGRVKKTDNLQRFHTVISEFTDYKADILTVSEFILFESRLQPQGAVHIPLKRMKL
jgi:RNA 2',3'-cyclic 3'-phosphodiesterase